MKTLASKRLTQLGGLATHHDRRQRSPQFSVLFMSRKISPKSKTAPIYGRITFDKNRALFSTGIVCNVADFNPATLTIANQPEKSRLLQSLKSSAESVYTEFRLTGRDINVTIIRDVLLGRSIAREQVPTLLQCFIRFLTERSKPEVETGDIDRDTNKQHERWANRIGEYFTIQYGPNCQLSDVKPADAKGLLLDLKQRSKHCHNYAEKIVQHTKRMLNFAMEKQWIDRNPFMNYRAKRIFKKGEFLTAEEVNLIEQSILISPILNRIKDIFLFQCYTGLAYRDVQQLQKSHILTDKETGWQYIRKERQKTGTMQLVPLIPSALAILEKYKKDGAGKHDDLLLPIPSNQKTNGYLQQIAGCLNITKIVRTHVARRTFSNLFKAMGMDVKNISVMLGHTNTAMTERHYLNTEPATVIRDMEKALSSAQQKEA